MRGIKVATLLVALVMLSACATPERPAMSKEERTAVTSRLYDGKTRDDVFRAAETLFRLADEDDFKISYPGGNMVAIRPWIVYMVLSAMSGTDVWTIMVDDTPSGVLARADVQTTIPSMVSKYSGGAVKGTAIYDIFWARMDFLLGKSGHWMTCEESNARIEDGTVWGSNEALCNSFNMKDNPPGSLPR